MRALMIIAALAALLVSSGAEHARADACRPDQASGLLCGEGREAFRIIEDTTSPSASHAFAWRSSRGFPVGDDFPPPDVENLLVRLGDGKVLARLGGEYWSTGESRANRYDLIAAWSPDGRAVVEAASSRWETDSFKFYLIDADQVRVIDLRPLVEPAMKARLPKSRRESQAFRVREDQPVKLDQRGRLRFTAMLYVPKSETSFDCAVDMAIDIKQGTPSARLLSIRRVRSQ